MTAALAPSLVCSQVSIRNYETLSRVPRRAKQMPYEERLTMRKPVQVVRDAQKRQEVAD